MKKASCAGAQEAGLQTRGSTLIYRSFYNRSRTHFHGTPPKGLAADGPYSLKGIVSATLFDHSNVFLYFTIIPRFLSRDSSLSQYNSCHIPVKGGTAAEAAYSAQLNWAEPSDRS